MAIDPFFGSVLAAGANLAGGLVGGAMNASSNARSRDEAAANRQAQYEFAQYGTTWKALDAINAYKATGIHPLALLGVSGPTYSPVSSAFVSSPVGPAIAAMGQDISRGIHASADRELRAEAFAAQQVKDKLLVERGMLENQALRLQILSQEARMRQDASVGVAGPGTRFLVDGQGNSGLAPRGGLEGLVKVKPLEVSSADPAKNWQEPAAIVDHGWAKVSANEWKRVPSKDIKERIEELPMGGWEWYFRNNVWFDDKTPPFAAPRGMMWVRDPVQNLYRLVPHPDTTLYEGPLPPRSERR